MEQLASGMRNTPDLLRTRAPIDRDLFGLLISIGMILGFQKDHLPRSRVFPQPKSGVLTDLTCPKIAVETTINLVAGTSHKNPISYAREPNAVVLFTITCHRRGQLIRPSLCHNLELRFMNARSLSFFVSSFMGFALGVHRLSEGAE